MGIITVGIMHLGESLRTSSLVQKVAVICWKTENGFVVIQKFKCSRSIHVKVSGQGMDYNIIYMCVYISFKYEIHSSFLTFLCWSIASEQCFSSFRWTAKGLSRTYTCIHSLPNTPPF